MFEKSRYARLATALDVSRKVELKTNENRTKRRLMVYAEISVSRDSSAGNEGNVGKGRRGAVR